MSSSSFDTFNSALTTGTIIAIVVSSIFGLALLIGTIVTIACIIKHVNRPKNAAARGMIRQPVQPYPYSYSQSWSNPNSPSTANMINYPSMYQTVSAPYTVPVLNEVKQSEP